MKKTRSSSVSDSEQTQPSAPGNPGTLIAGRADRRKRRHVIGSLHTDGRKRNQLTANRLAYTFECIYFAFGQDYWSEFTRHVARRVAYTVRIGNNRPQYGRNTRDCLALCCLSRFFRRSVDDISSFSSPAPVLGGLPQVEQYHRTRIRRRRTLPKSVLGSEKPVATVNASCPVLNHVAPVFQQLHCIHRLPPRMSTQRRPRGGFNLYWREMDSGSS